MTKGKGTFKCPECTETFEKKKDFLDHIYANPKCLETVQAELSVITTKKMVCEFFDVE